MKRLKNAVQTALIGLFLILAVSCSVDSDAQDAGDDIERADMKFKTVTYTVSRKDISPITFTAETLELYTDKDTAIMTGARFVQKGENGDVIMEGSCDKAFIDTYTYSCSLYGDVEIYRPVDKVRIISSDISWDNDRQWISTDKQVIMEYEGSMITGTGLTCSFADSTYEFDSIDEGRLEI